MIDKEEKNLIAKKILMDIILYSVFPIFAIYLDVKRNLPIECTITVVVLYLAVIIYQIIKIKKEG